MLNRNVLLISALVLPILAIVRQGEEPERKHHRTEQIPWAAFQWKGRFEDFARCPTGATGHFHYPPDCKRFLNCWKGRGHVQICAPGTLFNPSTRECDHPSKVTCADEDGFQGEQGQVALSYVRFPGERPPIGTNPRFAKQREEDDDDSESEEDEGRKFKGFTGRPPYFGPSHLNRPTRRPDVSQPKSNEPAECAPGATGHFPHPTDCHQFLHCWSGRTFIKQCGPGTAFNPSISVCDHIYNVKSCGEQKASPTTDDAVHILPPEYVRKGDPPAETKVPPEFVQPGVSEPDPPTGRNVPAGYRGSKTDQYGSKQPSRKPKIKFDLFGNPIAVEYVPDGPLFKPHHHHHHHHPHHHPQGFNPTARYPPPPAEHPQPIPAPPTQSGSWPQPFGQNEGDSRRYPQGSSGQSLFPYSFQQPDFGNQPKNNEPVTGGTKHQPSRPGYPSSGQGVPQNEQDGTGYPQRGPGYSQKQPTGTGPGSSQKRPGYPPNQFNGGGQPPNQFNGGYPPNQYNGGGQRPNQFNSGYPPNQFQSGGQPPNQFQSGGNPPNQYNGGGQPPNQFNGQPPNQFQSGGQPPNQFQSGGNPPNQYNGGGQPPNQFNGGGYPHSEGSSQTPQGGFQNSRNPAGGPSYPQRNPDTPQNGYAQETPGNPSSDKQLPPGYYNLQQKPLQNPLSAYPPDSDDSQNSQNPFGQSGNPQGNPSSQTFPAYPYSSQQPKSDSQTQNTPNTQNRPPYPGYSQGSQPYGGNSQGSQPGNSQGAPPYPGYSKGSPPYGGKSQGAPPYPGNSQATPPYTGNSQSVPSYPGYSQVPTEKPQYPPPYPGYSQVPTEKPQYPPPYPGYSQVPTEKPQYPPPYPGYSQIPTEKPQYPPPYPGYSQIPTEKPQYPPSPVYQRPPKTNTQIVPNINPTRPDYQFPGSTPDNDNQGQETQGQILESAEEGQFYEPEPTHPPKPSKQPAKKYQPSSVKKPSSKSPPKEDNFGYETLSSRMLPDVENVTSKPEEKPAPPSGQNLRLRGGATALDGYLEVRGPDGQWGLACDQPEDWNIDEASVVCHELGYNRGAKLSWQGYPMKPGAEKTRVNVDKIVCKGDGYFEESCNVTFVEKSQCEIGRSAIGISCYNNIASTCQPGEVHLSSHCYSLQVSNQSGPGHSLFDAADECLKMGGHVLDLNTQTENDFISEWLLRSHPNVTAVMTAGVGVTFMGMPMWVWQGTDAPMLFQKWWTGWSGERPLPEGRMNQPACLVMKRKFPCPVKSKEVKEEIEDMVKPQADCVTDYFFWDVEPCELLKPQYFPFVCERPMSDIGCVEGRGETYTGTANTTASGKPCLPWDHPKVIQGLARRGGQERSSQLTGHNFCRNIGKPDHHPWCFVEGSENSEFCDIPHCYATGTAEPSE